jgi:hypothetical protein
MDPTGSAGIVCTRKDESKQVRRVGCRRNMTLSAAEQIVKVVRDCRKKCFHRRVFQVKESRDNRRSQCPLDTGNSGHSKSPTNITKKNICVNLERAAVS